jgi:predicted alpha/beta hydrolase
MVRPLFASTSSCQHFASKPWRSVSDRPATSDCTRSTCQGRTPITVLHALDDDIATPRTVADLLRTLPVAQKQVFQVKPAQHGLKSIGHIDWFRSSHQALWPMIAGALRGTD